MNDKFQKLIDIAIKNNGKVVSKAYVDRLTTYSWQCSEGHIFENSYDRMKRNGTWCPACMKKKVQERLKHSYQYVLDFIQKKGGILLSKEYVQSHAKLLIDCGNGHKWKATFDCLKRAWCPKCYGKRRSVGTRKSVEWFLDSIKDRGVELISKKYINTKSKYKFRCKKCTHIFVAQAEKVKHGTGCPSCAGILKKDISEMHQLAAKNSGKFLSKEYTGMRFKHLWECEAGHQWMTYPNSIQQGCWCPHCNNDSKGEIAIDKYLMSKGYVINNTYFREHSFDGCIYKRPLQFDFYIPSQNLIIEFDHIQHFRPVKYFGGDIGFEGILRRDSIKNQYCKDNGINLLRIPYCEFKNINDILDRYL